ncbi:hypothetical protein WSK_3428 [Novosphingobium sp. Rr 2-17]|nr:hypothetical protein WSK_3428 [Novosphingobium sp. Rr 2-17]
MPTLVGHSVPNSRSPGADGPFFRHVATASGRLDQPSHPSLTDQLPASRQAALPQTSFRSAMPSPQLAIFAASPVHMRVNDSFIALPLAGYAGARTRQCLTPTCGDGLATVFTMLKALASWHPPTGAADRVTYSVINLILHRAIARPSTGHIRFHSSSWPDVGTRSVWLNASSSLRPRHRVKVTAMVASSAITAGRFVSARHPASQMRCLKAYRRRGAKPRHHSRPKPVA